MDEELKEILNFAVPVLALVSILGTVAFGISKRRKEGKEEEEKDEVTELRKKIIKRGRLFF